MLLVEAPPQPEVVPQVVQEAGPYVPYRHALASNRALLLYVFAAPRGALWGQIASVGRGIV